MKKNLLSFLMLLFASSSYCVTWTVTNLGFTFTPATITINQGDDVNFSIASIHAVTEVSLATWNTNGNTALPGGFSTVTGGGLVPASLLTPGTHYYVCAFHYFMGMKGTIIVQSPTGITDYNLQPDFTAYPNPARDLLTIRADGRLTDSKFFLTDNSGRQVLDGKLNDEVTLIDISKLRTGFYILQISGLKGQSVKLVKK